MALSLRRIFVSLLGAATLASCGKEAPRTVADMFGSSPAVRQVPLDVASGSWLRSQVVLGQALVGGTAAHKASPPPPPPAAGFPALDLAPQPVELARARLEETTQRTLATRQLLDVWARADATETKNDPNLVRQAQRLLAALGYYNGPVTGVNGPLSGAAIRQFQAVRGLPETGDVTTSLLVALRAAL
jgi:hypothetical protein